MVVVSLLFRKVKNGLLRNKREMIGIVTFRDSYFIRVTYIIFSTARHNKKSQCQNKISGVTRQLTRIKLNLSLDPKKQWTLRLYLICDFAGLVTTNLLTNISNWYRSSVIQTDICGFMNEVVNLCGWPSTKCKMTCGQLYLGMVFWQEI